MRVILACQHFSSVGGTQTYLLTVAEELQRLGHDATIVAEAHGEMSELAAARGVPVATFAAAPAAADALITRDGVVAARLAAEHPTAAHLFVAPSETFDFQLPPPVAGAVSEVVTLSDRMRARIEALAAPPAVTRLAHPVDLRRFAPRTEPREQARNVLLLGNYLRGARRELVAAACEELGLEWRQIGAHGPAVTADPVAALDWADIVIGKARAIVEAMACGRAAYVMDAFGTDGWVTPESYAALEADNFAGRVGRDGLTRARLRADLERYDPAMGLANRDLAVAGHSAGRHAEALVARLRHAGAREPADPDALAQVERLTRLLARAEGEAGLLRTEVDDVRGELSAAGAAVDAWARRAQDAEARLAAITATRRYRLASLIGAPADLLRGRGRRSAAQRRQPGRPGR